MTDAARPYRLTRCKPGSAVIEHMTTVCTLITLMQYIAEGWTLWAPEDEKRPERQQ